MNSPTSYRRSLFQVCALSFSLLGMNHVQAQSTAPAKPHTFTFGGNKGQEFLFNGKPIQVRAGEMHPQRIPKEYWRHRIQMTKAMGMNTIAFYTMWNDFEQADGSFDFKTGERDIATFLKICHEEGMLAIFRPGPYVCAEWDFGGLPIDLLKDPNVRLRTLKDANFMKRQTRYLDAIAEVARPFLLKNGGPIVMTQIENEYGSWAKKETEYMQWLLDYWTKKGFGPFNTSDGAGDGYLKGVVLPGVAVGLNPAESDEQFEAGYRNNPGVPVFSAETYPGWLRHWGEGNWKATNKTDSLNYFMSKGLSFNIFVIHGGTNFGFTAGANHQSANKTDYTADITSYDYGSPINEQGNAAPEYQQYRDLISKQLPAGEKLIDIPAPIPAMEIADFTPKKISGLWQNLPKAFAAKTPPFFESFDQNQGLAIYRTNLPAGAAAKFEFEQLHDYALFYLDGKLISTYNRSTTAPQPIEIPARSKESKLEILVEGMGHINYHVAMENDRKGLYGKVTLDQKPLENWEVIPLPLSAKSITSAAVQEKVSSTMPGSHFRAEINIAEPKDTFLDMSKYNKGFVWVNGKNLGRYWQVGPQLRLYCPGVWLKKGKNVIDIVDLDMSEARPIRGCKERNYDELNKETRNANNVW